MYFKFKIYLVHGKETKNKGLSSDQTPPLPQELRTTDYIIVAAYKRLGLMITRCNMDYATHSYHNAGGGVHTKNAQGKLFFEKI